MTRRNFLIADLHLDHERICEIIREDGSKLRPWSNTEDMRVEMVKRWNATVRPIDKVYVLGDVAMRRKGLQTLYQCNGDKVLIKGNHDQERIEEYLPIFRDIRACWQIAKCLLTHIPIHPQSVSRWRANIHGHLHYRRVMLGDQPDQRYICVSVEHIDYRPILLDQVLHRLPA